MIPLSSYLSVAAILFVIGLYGALTKKNTILVLMAIELMLNAVNLNLIAFSAYSAVPDAATVLRGQIFSIFIMVVAAAEIGVGLAIVLLLFTKKNTIHIGEFSSLKG